MCCDEAGYTAGSDKNAFLRFNGFVNCEAETGYYGVDRHESEHHSRFSATVTES